MFLTRLISFISLVIISFSATAQFNYQGVNAQVIQGVYTDLGTCGTVINASFSGSPIEYDDTVSAAYNIGFTFVFNSGSYTKFVLSTNGFIKLGTAAPAAYNYDFISSSDVNIISPFNVDLEGNIAPEYRVCVSGVAPNRVCTIQFKDLRDIQGISNQYASLNFQIKLYETTNNIDFVYGTFTPTLDPAVVIPVKAGIKGSNSSFTVNAFKKSYTPWISSSFIDGPYVTDNFNIRNSVLPVPGLTIRFRAFPLVANDARVTFVYSMAELPKSVGFPHIIKAQVKNVGANAFTNLPVFLSMSGANSFSDTANIPSLASGASADVSFDAFSPLSYGVSDLVVSIPPDGNNANNSVTWNQRVNEGLYSIADSSPALSYVGFGNASGISLVKYNANNIAVITGIRAYISNDQNSIGKSVFGAVLNAGGFLAARSPNVILTANDLNKYMEFSLNNSVMFSDIEFYAGLGQSASPLIPYYPLGYQYEGTTPRTLTYYSTAEGGGPLVQSNNSGRYMIQALVNSTPFPPIDNLVKVCPGDNQILVAPQSGSVYQWQVNTGSGFTALSNNINYSGISNDTLFISNISSSWYGYQYACSVDAVLGAAYTMKIESIWTGAVNNVWENSGNWSCALLPDANTDVIIPDGAMPVLSTLQSCRSIFINNNAKLDILSLGRLTVTK